MKAKCSCGSYNVEMQRSDNVDLLCCIRKYRVHCNQCGKSTAAYENTIDAELEWERINETIRTDT